MNPGKAESKKQKAEMILTLKSNEAGPQTGKARWLLSRVVRPGYALPV